MFSHLSGKRIIFFLSKKGDKQTLKNDRPVSLLPICGKILERLMFNEIFKLFIENDLISSNQSDFKPGDSCLIQLVSILHEGHEIRGDFLDISKTIWLQSSVR